MENLKNDWNEILKDEFTKPYYRELMNFIEDEYKNNIVYPSKKDIFNAFNYTSYKNTSVVILGQDPYHGANQAHGLAFSVKIGNKIPPSLLNIYKELNNEEGCYTPNNGYLESWSRQGVLLLNTVLTVREGEPNSHKNKGWELFTDKVILELSNKKDPVIFVLWGANARSKKNLIDMNNNFVLESPHPSPLSARRGFFGCDHFIKINEILSKINKNKIDWQIKNI